MIGVEGIHMENMLDEDFRETMKEFFKSEPKKSEKRISRGLVRSPYNEDSKENEEKTFFQAFRSMFPGVTNSLVYSFESSIKRRFRQINETTKIEFVPDRYVRISELTPLPVTAPESYLEVVAPKYSAMIPPLGRQPQKKIFVRKYKELEKHSIGAIEHQIQLETYSMSDMLHREWDKWKYCNSVDRIHITCAYWPMTDTLYVKR